MDITIGNNRCQAEATYTVRSYKKAAYWLLKYLESAEAVQIVMDIAEQIRVVTEEANREESEITATGENWNCEIEKMAQGVFRVKLVWTTTEPVVRRGRKKKTAA